MPSLQQLRRRLKSVKSIHQITRAMEMVATSKMKLATKKAVSARDYSNAISEMFSSLGNQPHPLLENREVENIALVLVTSDRGLCGGFNSALFRKTIAFIEEIKERNQNISIITIGKKGRNFVLKTCRENFVADFTDIEDEIQYEEISPIAHLIIEDFINKKFDQVSLIYSHYISSFIQEPTLIQLLPVIYQEDVRQEDKYLLEPTQRIILDRLAPQFIETKIFHTLLESKASEHSARMVAMRNATENAKDLMDELYLTYHGLRQATITSELIEMTTAKRAMED